MKALNSVKFLVILSVLAMPTAATATTVIGPLEGQPSAEDAKAIGDLLADEALDAGPVALAATQTRHALSSILQRGFAQTPSIERAVNEIFADPLRMMRQPSWLDELERRGAEARLRGLPVHAGIGGLGIAYDIPLADHALVDVYIKHFSGRGRWFFAKWLARADRYLPIMQPILESMGLPRDLVYVAMVESGFSSHAVSIAAAGGFWQFIPTTGKQFGLETSFWLDERRDFILATKAAATYMAQLHRQFGDWHLAWAGYNAGGGRVSRALKKYGADDYWTLVDEKGSLAKETRHYVPKILAAAIVAKNRVRYGFGAVKSLPPLLYDEIKVDGAVHLRVVAKHLGVTLNTLRELNPALLQDVTPPGRRFQLRVPQGRGEKTAAWLAALPASKRVTYRRHKIRKGDTLYVLARRYGTSMSAIREFNGIRNPRALRLGKDLIIPSVRGGTPVVKRKAATKSKPAPKRVARAPIKTKKTKRSPPRLASAKTSSGSHVVSAGETLWSIARRYDVSVTRLKRWNKRHSNVIVVGETLELF